MSSEPTAAVIAAFFDAAERGDLALAQVTFNADPDVVHSRNKDGATALHVAALRGHRKFARWLVERCGAEINARDQRFGATPSAWAIEYLRGFGGLLSVEIDHLECAIKNREVHWVRRLLEEHPALLRASTADGRSLDELARSCGEPQIEELFDM